MPQHARTPTHCAYFLLSAMLTFSPFAVHAQDASSGQLGKKIFMTAAPPCSVCHTLADAGATGKIGPNLDKKKYTKERVQAAVRGGVGIMPAYGEKLTEEQIAAVSAYVTAAGQAKK